MFIKMTEFFKRTEQYNWKFYCGTVVDNEDPKKLKRVKVTIDGIFAGDKANLPWTMPFTDSTKRVRVPDIGEKMVVIFPFDDIYHPAFLGYWNTGDKNESYLEDNYPKTFGFIETGLKAKFNKETKDGEIVHESTTRGKVKADGTLEFFIKKDLKIIVEGRVEKTVTGDFSISSEAKVSVVGKDGVDISSDEKVSISGKSGVNIVSDSSIKIDGKGGVEVTSDAQAKFAGKGGTTVGDSVSVTNVNGSTVMLAGGGGGVAVLGSQSIGTGNMGAPVVSSVIQGSSKVFAPS